MSSSECTSQYRSRGEEVDTEGLSLRSRRSAPCRGAGNPSICQRSMSFHLSRVRASFPETHGHPLMHCIDLAMANEPLISGFKGGHDPRPLCVSRASTQAVLCASFKSSRTRTCNCRDTETVHLISDTAASWQILQRRCLSFHSLQGSKGLKVTCRSSSGSVKLRWSLSPRCFYFPASRHQGRSVAFIKDSNNAENTTAGHAQPSGYRNAPCNYLITADRVVGTYHLP